MSLLPHWTSVGRHVAPVDLVPPSIHPRPVYVRLWWDHPVGAVTFRLVRLFSLFPPRFEPLHCLISCGIPDTGIDLTLSYATDNTFIFYQHG